MSPDISRRRRLSSSVSVGDLSRAVSDDGAKRDGRGRRFEPNEAGRSLKNRAGRQFARRRGRKETAAEVPPYGSRDPALIGQGPIVDSGTEDPAPASSGANRCARRVGAIRASGATDTVTPSVRSATGASASKGTGRYSIRIVGELLLALPLPEFGRPLKALELHILAICVRSLGCVRVLKDWLADGLWTVVEEAREVLDWSALTAPVHPTWREMWSSQMMGRERVKLFHLGSRGCGPNRGGPSGR